MSNDRGAVALVSGAYIWWGSSAIFWNELSSVSPTDQLSYRVITAFLYLTVGVGLLRTSLTRVGIEASLFAPGALRSHLTRRHLLYGAGAAIMISSNWALFLWAVSNGQAVEAALGYFLMPFFSVALGVAILGERLRPLQVAALTLSAVGIVWTVITVGRLPLIAIFVGLTFAVYGFLRKQGPWDALSGVTFETGFLLPVFGASLLIRGIGGSSVFGDGSAYTLLLITLTGLVTIIPLVSFGSAARRVPLAVIGLLQYINPTLQFLVGWQVLGESVGGDRLLGFVWIWVALALIVFDELGSKRPVDGLSASGDQRLVGSTERTTAEKAAVRRER